MSGDKIRLVWRVAVAQISPLLQAATRQTQSSSGFSEHAQAFLGVQGETLCLRSESEKSKQNDPKKSNNVGAKKSQRGKTTEIHVVRSKQVQATAEVEVPVRVQHLNVAHGPCTDSSLFQSARLEEPVFGQEKLPTFSLDPAVAHPFNLPPVSPIRGSRAAEDNNV